MPPRNGLVAAGAFAVAVAQRFQQACQQAGGAEAVVAGVGPVSAEQIISDSEEFRASSAVRTPPAGLKPTVFDTPISRITSSMMRALSGVALTGTFTGRGF